MNTATMASNVTDVTIMTDVTSLGKFCAPPRLFPLPIIFVHGRYIVWENNLYNRGEPGAFNDLHLSVCPTNSDIVIIFDIFVTILFQNQNNRLLHCCFTSTVNI